MPDSPPNGRDTCQDPPPRPVPATRWAGPLSVWRALALSLVYGGVLCGLATWSGGFGARVSGDDLHGQFIARYRFIAQRYAEGHFPLWNPFELTGIPMHAASHGSALYPPVALLNMVADAWTALQSLYYLHLVAYLLVVLLYLTRTGLGPVAASLGAVAAVSCTFTTVLQLGRDHPSFICAMPWVVGVLWAWWCFTRGQRRAAVLVSLCCSVVAFAGYAEFDLTLPVLLGLAALTLNGMPLIRGVAIAAGLYLLGEALAAAQLVPLAELVEHSARGEWAAAGRHFVDRWKVTSAGLLVKELLWRYSGPLVWLAVLGLLHRHRSRLFWSAAMLWAFLPGNPPFSFLYEIPPFSYTRYLFTWGFYQAMLVGFMAAAGLQGVLADADPRAWHRQLALGAATAFAIGAFGMLKDAAIVLLCVACALPPLRRRGAIVVPIGLVALHAFQIMGQIGTSGRLPPPDFEVLRPRVEVLRELQRDHPAPVRFIAAEETRAGLTTPAGVYAANGYEPSIPPRRIARILQALVLPPLTDSRAPRARRQAWRRFEKHPGAVAALGIGFVVSPWNMAQALLRSGFEVVRRFPGGDVVLYKEPAPSYALVHAVSPSESEERSLALLLDASFDPRESVILEGDEAAVATAPRPAGVSEEVRIVDRSPEHVALRVRAASDGVLVAHETFFPGWTATVDGRPVEILRANYAFRAVPIGVGEHDVSFHYRPRSFVLGCSLSLAAAVVLVLLWLRLNSSR